MSRVKVISSSLVLNTKLFDISKSSVAIENGKKWDEYEIHRKPSVLIFPMTPSYEIYLISQYRHMYDTVFLEAPAGYMNDGEDPQDAAKRELKEETGLTAKEFIKLPHMLVAHSVIKGTQHLFAARNLEEGTATPEDDEDIRVVKISLDKAISYIFSGKINDAASVIGILMVDKMRQEGKV